MTAAGPDTVSPLGVTLPTPGWTLLDAASQRRFTGEIALGTLPEVRVYLDRGEIYLAERITDPSLGDRLVDAGVMNSAQLEQGTIRLGDAEHLGRLFERMPSIDRDAVTTVADMMTAECVGWVADQTIVSATAAPFRHHPSGVHRWHQPVDEIELQPGDPLPAPLPDESPIATVAPDFSLVPTDDLISWNEPSWLEGGTRRSPAAPPAPPLVAPPAPTPAPTPAPVPTPVGPSAISPDWAAGLGIRVVSTPSTPTPAPTSPQHSSFDMLDRFEVIWPSGEIDDQFDDVEISPVSDHHPDLDRAGPTARLDRPSATPDVTAPAPDPVPIVSPPELKIVEPPTDPGDVIGDRDGGGPGTIGRDPIVGDVALAVRKTVASIESGALATRERPTATTDDDPSLPSGLIPPGRVAIRNEQVERTVMSTSPSGIGTTPTRSVFDEVAPEPEPPEPTEASEPSTTAGGSRSGALRRLIGSLRRR